MDTFTAVLLVIGVAILSVLGATWLLRPALARMGIGYALHRKKQAALITAGLMVATTVIAAAGIAADSSGRSFTESLLGRLELTDVILEGVHASGGIAEADAQRFVQDPRLPRPDAVALTLRSSLAFEDAASGLGDEEVAVWGIDPASFAGVGRLRALEGEVPATLSAWPSGGVVVNEAAAKAFGMIVGDRAFLYAAGQEVARPVQEHFDGHLVFATWSPAPGGPLQDSTAFHHPDDVYAFTFNATRQVPLSDLRISVDAPADPDAELVLSVTSPGLQVFEAGPATGPVNVTVPADEANFGPAAWTIEVHSPLATDVEIRATATEVQRQVLGEKDLELRTVAIVDQRGSDPLENAPVVFLPLPVLQDFLEQPGHLNVVLVDYPSDVDLEGLDPQLHAVRDDIWPGGVQLRNDRASLERERDRLEDAVRFTFLGIGSFSILAGFMLIGVMMALLAEERKRILATSRAIGAQRSALTLAHAHEGSVYSLLAGLAGLVGALLLASALVGPLRQIFQAEGSRFVLVLDPATAVQAVAAGFALTMVAIVLSAHAASRFHIAAALKGEERETKGGRRLGVAVAVGLAAVGGLVSLTGAAGSAWGAVLGPCVLAVGVSGVLARIVGRNTAHAASGLLLSLYLIASFWLIDVSDDDAEFLLFPLRGVLLSISLAVFAAYSTWVHGAIVWVGNRTGRAGAYLEAALAHLRQRPGRAALTISMFGTVLVVLTALGTLFATFQPEDLGDTGGFGVVADTSLALGDPEQYLRGNPPASGVDPFSQTARWVATPWVERGAGQLYVRLDQEDARFTSPYAPFSGDEAESAVAVTAGFQQQAAFRPVALRPGLADMDAAFSAVRADASLIIVSDQLEYYDFDADDRVPLRIGDRLEVNRASDDNLVVTVVAIVGDVRSVGAMVHPHVLGAMASRAGFEEPGTRIWAEAQAGTTDRELAQTFEAAFRRAGMHALAADHVDEQEAAVGGAFQTMISLFLGLGIVIGMVSLALIMGRNVLIRRAEIGTLRALGASPQGILGMFSVEALYVSLTSIGIGLGVGLLLAWATVRSDAIFVPLRIDWGALVVLYTVTLLAALAAAFVPAWQASRVPPAQAVRYSE